MHGCCHPSRPCSLGRQRGVRGAGSSDKGELIGLLLLFMALLLSGESPGVFAYRKKWTSSRAAAGRGCPGVGAGGSVALAGRAGREEAPTSFLAMPPLPLRGRPLPPHLPRGCTQSWCQSKACGHTTALSLAGQVTWSEVLANSKPHFPHL